MATQAGTTSPPPMQVTEENFNRAESDMYFGNRVKEVGIGTLFHYREVMPIEKQAVIRANRDTLYSTGVFDLHGGPVTVPTRSGQAVHVDDRDR